MARIIGNRQRKPVYNSQKLKEHEFFLSLNVRYKHIAQLWIDRTFDPAIVISRWDGNTLTPSLLFLSIHPTMEDYVKQAPVIAATDKLFTNGHEFQEKPAAKLLALRELCKDRPKLNQILKFLDIPTPLRKLHPGTIRPNQIQPFRLIKPSTLAQSVPDIISYQCSFCNNISDIFSLGIYNQNFPSMDWWAKNIPVVRRRHSITEIRDYLRAQHEPFNERWNWERFINEVDQWHREIVEHRHENDWGGKYEVDVDFSPLPNEIIYFENDYSVVPLRSVKALVEEGQIMKHCVASYGHNLHSGDCWIYSIRHQGKSCATFELGNGIINGTIAMRQFKSHRNGPPTKEDQEIYKEWVKHNNASGLIFAGYRLS